LDTVSPSDCAFSAKFSVAAGRDLWGALLGFFNERIYINLTIIPLLLCSIYETVCDRRGLGALISMNRRELLKRSAAAGFLAAVPFSHAAKRIAGLGASARIGGADSSGSAAAVNPLKPPKSGTIEVAYPLSHGVVDIDFTGPWAIFGSVMLPGVI
jgi:hypothetical protein